MPALAYIALGMLRSGSMVSPTWHAGRLEGGCGESEEVQPTHGARELPEGPAEGHLEVERRGAMPVDVAGEHGNNGREERQRSRSRGDDHRQDRHAAKASEVRQGEGDDEACSPRYDRNPGQVPLVQRRSAQQWRSANGVLGSTGDRRDVMSRSNSTTPLPQRRTMTVEEAAALVGVGRSTLYQYVKRGDIPCVRLGRRIVIPVHVVEALLAGTERPSVG